MGAIGCRRSGERSSSPTTLIMLLSSFSIHDEIEDSHDFRSDLDKDPAGLIHSRRLSYKLKSISFEPSHSSRLVCPSTIAISAGLPEF